MMQLEGTVVSYHRIKDAISSETHSMRLSIDELLLSLILGVLVCKYSSLHV